MTAPGNIPINAKRSTSRGHQFRAELAASVPVIEPDEHPYDQYQQGCCDQNVPADQPGIVSLEEFGVFRGGRKQEKQNAHHGAADDPQIT